MGGIGTYDPDALDCICLDHLVERGGRIRATITAQSSDSKVVRCIRSNLLIHHVRASIGGQLSKCHILLRADRLVADLKAINRAIGITPREYHPTGLHRLCDGEILRHDYIFRLRVS